MNMPSRSIRPSVGGLQRQRGISLFMVMMFLVILSILGVTAIQSSTFSARIAGNEADRTLAFQAAESALRDAEKDIGGSCLAANCRTTPISPEAADIFGVTCALGLCLPDATTPVWEVKANWTTAGRAATYGTYTGPRLCLWCRNSPSTSSSTSSSVKPLSIACLPSATEPTAQPKSCCKPL